MSKVNKAIPSDLPSKLAIALYGDRIVSYAVNSYFSKQARVITAASPDRKPSETGKNAAPRQPKTK